MSETGAGDGGLRAAALIAYGLFVLALFNGATAIAGVVVAYVKRDAARGTPWEGHFRNLIRVFWISVAVAVLVLAAIAQGFGGLLFSMAQTDGNPPPALVGTLFLLVPALFIVGTVFAVWYLYRTLRGLIRAIEGAPY
ncbi:MAG TPA: hypothetical protein VGC36_12695 [Rhizomicrobium sp.]